MSMLIKLLIIVKCSTVLLNNRTNTEKENVQVSEHPLVNVEKEDVKNVGTVMLLKKKLMKLWLIITPTDLG
jgi:hypothetical protein